MGKNQRLVVAAYCLLLAYCCVWIPWSIPQRDSHERRVGYGWLWAGPRWAEPHEINVPPPPTGFTIDSDETIPDPDPRHAARPDLEVMFLRFLAATIISGAAFLLAGMFGMDFTTKKPPK